MGKVRKIRFILLLTTLGSALLGTLFAKLAITAAAVFFLSLAFFSCIGELVYTLIFWRCPSCGRHLPIKGAFWGAYCPYCGDSLEGEYE